VITPLLVATIQRLPQRTIESILPKPGTELPRVTFKVPLGPSNTTDPPTTSRTVQPGMVVGRVSGVGAGLGPGRVFARCCAAASGGPAAARFCRATFETGFVGLGGAGVTTFRVPVVLGVTSLLFAGRKVSCSEPRLGAEELLKSLCEGDEEKKRYGLNPPSHAKPSTARRTPVVSMRRKRRSSPRLPVPIWRSLSEAAGTVIPI
jgi:hypothetical protein